MSDVAPETKTNALGLSRADYIGSKSTLCTGCGHDSITNQLISALFQSDINPYKLVKISGIGCSSKTPAYFAPMSHGFNTLHGRMAPIATGAKIANQQLTVLGVSGDGDTASIGMGGFIHLLRRNLPMVYIVENNGVYGLTKGQFSATADIGSLQKTGERNPFETVDLCSLAIEVGCGFVARSFSGDSKQLQALLATALRHPGTAFIDVISPCITFANHPGSTKSYDYVKEHKVTLQELGFIQPAGKIEADYAEGDVQTILLHDGSRLLLKKLDSREHNVADKISAIQKLHEARDKQEILTGLFYLNEKNKNLIDSLNLTDTPLTQLDEKLSRPSIETLSEIMREFC